MPPYNGSGSFSPYVPGNPVIPGTVISSTAFNATQQDIAAGLSNAVTRDGQSPLTANLPAAGRKITGLGAGVVAGDSLRFEQLFSQGTEQDIASAATVDIGGLNTTIARITGTTTITSFGTNYNGPRYVRFAGAITLTHNATTLILPGGANITTAAGDRAILTPVGNPASGWQVVAYEVAALPPGTASSAATLTGTVAIANGGTGATTAPAARTNLGLDPLVCPAGMIAPFARTTAPTGWLALPLVPTNISRTGANADLFAAIGTNWGAGDGSTTFGMPYMPENYAPVQANANVGTSTAGQVIAHTHTTGTYNTDSGAADTARAGSTLQVGTITTSSTGGAANLAAGIKFLYCVKL